MLRTRLFLYLVPFVAMLLAFGLYATLLLNDLTNFNQATIAHQPAPAAAEQMRQASEETIHLLIAGLIAVLVAASYVCYRIAQSFLKPIRALTRATRELGQGKPSPHLPVSKDELGELALAFNKMAGQLRDHRQTTAGKILRLHRTMEATIASFPDPIFLLNQEGRVNLMNPAAEGLSIDLHLQSQLPQPLEAPVQKAIQAGQNFLPHDFDQTISLRFGGRVHHFLPRIVIMRTKNEALLGVAVVLYDLTRFRLMDDLKTNLLETVSHELKTPLTGMRMAIHLLLEKNAGPLTPQQLDLLTTARDDSERLLTILNDILEGMRLEKVSASAGRGKARSKAKLKPAAPAESASP